MELFDKKEKKEIPPLSWRFYPKDFSEFVGQKEIIGEGKLLRRLIEEDSLRSAVFFGPTGVGKTALARLIAHKTKKRFIQLNATTSGVREISDIVKEADYNLRKGIQTLLVIDELHHFNKTQQDALLPHVERGVINFIGITSENPYYFLNKALLSRVLLFEFSPLSESDIVKILKNAIKKDSKIKDLKVKESILKKIAKFSNYDARRALNILEVLSVYLKGKEVNETVLKEVLSKRVFPYDKKGDEHYDTISAFIKSIRGSDPDASLYWLAKLIKLGEDPRFITRRLLILASEDIGLADPFAIVLSSSISDAIEKVGMPEAKILLSELVIYLCSAPKSNTCYEAIENALSYFETEKELKVPEHLTKKGSKKYKYPHSYGGWVKQSYLPEKVKFLNLRRIGYEKKIIERFENRVKGKDKKNIKENR
ncbi:MAG: replication-associated recombination protein A [Caldiserica bacterium]|nr:MAG: replication-associated recombination protein A [Caldisericota bacterium]